MGRGEKKGKFWLLNHLIWCSYEEVMAKTSFGRFYGKNLTGEDDEQFLHRRICTFCSESCTWSEKLDFTYLKICINCLKIGKKIGNVNF